MNFCDEQEEFILVTHCIIGQMRDEFLKNNEEMAAIWGSGAYCRNGIFSSCCLTDKSFSFFGKTLVMQSNASMRVVSSSAKFSTMMVDLPIDAATSQSSLFLSSEYSTWVKWSQQENFLRKASKSEPSNLGNSTGGVLMVRTCVDVDCAMRWA